MVKRVFHKYLDALLAPDIAYDHPHHRSSVAVTQEFGLHHDRIPPGRGWIQLVLVTTRAVVAVNGTLSFQKVVIEHCVESCPQVEIITLLASAGIYFTTYQKCLKDMFHFVSRHFDEP